MNLEVNNISVSSPLPICNGEINQTYVRCGNMGLFSALSLITNFISNIHHMKTTFNNYQHFD